jgi:hypothetical protein
VILAPIVIMITPDSAANSGPVDITNLGGANFQPGATVRLSQSGQADIYATKVVVVNAGKITCTFDLTGAAGGNWDVTVANPDGRSGSLPKAFKAAFAAPTVTSIAPNKGTSDQAAFSAAISGTAFRPGLTVSLSTTGEAEIGGTAISLISAREISVRFDLAGKPAGVRDVKVVNDDGQSGVLAQGFKLEAEATGLIGPVEFRSAPNPDYPGVKSTSIVYNLNKDTDIIIEIFSMRGEKIWQTTVPAGTEGAQLGMNEVVWNGITAFKSVAGSGVYLVYISARTPAGTKLLSKQKLGIIK